MAPTNPRPKADAAALRDTERLTDLLQQEPEHGSTARPHWQALLEAAERSGDALVAATAASRLAMLSTSEDLGVQAHRYLQRARAWAELAEPGSALLAMVRVAALSVLVLDKCGAEAVRSAQALVSDNGFAQLPARLRAATWMVMVQLCFSSGQPAALVTLLGATLHATQGCSPGVQAMFCWSAQTYLVGALLFSSPHFEARAMPWPRERGGWLSGLRHMASKLDVQLRSQAAELVAAAGPHVLDALRAMNRVGRNLDLPVSAWPSPAAAKTADPPVDQPGLAAACLYWRAAACLLEDRPHDALAAIKQSRLLTGADDTGMCDELFIECRAYAQLGQSRHALERYQRHVRACRQAAVHADGLSQSLLASANASLVHGQAALPDSSVFEAALERARAVHCVGVDVAQLAQWCARSDRWVRSEFLRRLETSPNHWLQDQRLLGLRHQILALGIPAGITKLAASWGFSNVSRFRAAYVNAFGETPQQTLRRALQGAQG